MNPKSTGGATFLAHYSTVVESTQFVREWADLGNGALGSLHGSFD